MVWGSHMTFGAINVECHNKCTLEHSQKCWFGSNVFFFSMVVIYVSKTSLGKPIIHFSGAFLAVSFRVYNSHQCGDIMAPLHIFSCFFWGKNIATSMTMGDGFFIYFWESSPLNLGKMNLPILENRHILGGGFKYVLSSPLFGEDFHFD